MLARPSRRVGAGSELPPVGVEKETRANARVSFRQAPEGLPLYLPCILRMCKMMLEISSGVSL